MNRSIITLSLLVCVHFAIGQDPCAYTAFQYDTWSEKNILFGESPLFNGASDSLFLDIYKPLADGNPDRPVIVWVYGGGFYSGNRQGMESICQMYAARGYVAVAIDYRLGFETPLLLSYPYTYDVNEIVRANYRAMQDARGALRFLKNRASLDSSDVENVFIGGFSAGGFTALATAFWDKAAEKPDACGEIAPANNSIPPSPRPDLGPVEGTLNLGGADATVKGVINMFGGVVDTSFIEGTETQAVYMYHQTTDPIVKCASAKPYWDIPLGVSGNYPVVHGSCTIFPRLINTGFDVTKLEFYEHTGNQHAVHDEALIDSLVALFLEDCICEEAVSTSSPGGLPVKVKAFPNPFKDQMNLQFPGPNGFTGQLQLMDLHGKVYWRSNVSRTRQYQVQVPDDLPKGIYLLRLRSGNNSRLLRLVKS